MTSEVDWDIHSADGNSLRRTEIEIVPRLVVSLRFKRPKWPRQGGRVPFRL